MVIPRALDEWTREAVERVVTLGAFEDDSYDFKAVLNSPDNAPDHNKRIVKAACSFANSGGGFLVFGVGEKGSGVERILGIPDSRENAKQLAEKLRAAEPSIAFDPQNPPILLDNGNVVLVVAIPKGRRGPHWDGTHKFWKRSHGTAEEMSYAEVELAFTNYSERLARLQLVFISLVDNWLRLEKTARHAAPADTLSISVPDVSQLRQHLAEVQSLCPEAIPSLLSILDVCDSISTRLSIIGAAVPMPLSNKDALIRSHNEAVVEDIKEAQPYFETALNYLQERFGFESVGTRLGDIPPIPEEEQ